LESASCLPLEVCKYCQSLLISDSYLTESSGCVVSMIRLKSLLSFGNSLDPSCKAAALTIKLQKLTFFQGTMSTLSYGLLPNSPLPWSAHAFLRCETSSYASTLERSSLRFAIPTTKPQYQYHRIQTQDSDVQTLGKRALLSFSR
jgi:hypothetical protein